MNYTISLFWLIIFIIFLVFICYHHKKSSQALKSLENLKPSSFGQVKILNIDFAEMLTKFKNELNNANQESHRIARNSFILAALTALISLVISLL